MGHLGRHLRIFFNQKYALENMNGILPTPYELE